MEIYIWAKSVVLGMKDKGAEIQKKRIAKYFNDHNICKIVLLNQIGYMWDLKYIRHHWKWQSRKLQIFFLHKKDNISFQIDLMNKIYWNIT